MVLSNYRFEHCKHRHLDLNEDRIYTIRHKHPVLHFEVHTVEPDARPEYDGCWINGVYTVELSDQIFTFLHERGIRFTKKIGDEIYRRMKADEDDLQLDIDSCTVFNIEKYIPI